MAWIRRFLQASPELCSYYTCTDEPCSKLNGEQEEKVSKSNDFDGTEAGAHLQSSEPCGLCALRPVRLATQSVKLYERGTRVDSTHAFDDQGEKGRRKLPLSA